MRHIPFRLFGLAFVTAFITNTSDAAQRPNIVMIMADDLGFECIGANGGTSYKTPHLDQMAAQGVRFEHCYSQAICTPSRVKLMTGIYNVRNYAKFGFLETSQRTFGNILSDAGYKTCIVGKWQLGKDPKSPKHFGFSEHCLWQLFRRPSRYPSPGLEVNGEPKDYMPGYGPDVVTDYALNFIDENKDKPFLLYYPMILTHCPFEPTPDSADWDASSKGSKTYKGDAKYFGDMVSYMDKIIGKILSKLEEAGVRENTLVIFTGDNGTDTPVVSMMGERKVAGAKGETTDGGTHVPLIVQWQGKSAKGLVSKDLVDFSDFLPTMCEAAGVVVPESPKLDGRSFLPQVLGEAGNPREFAYVWYARNGGPKGKEFTRNQRYKLYRSGKFYDIEKDPLEKTPLDDSQLTRTIRETKKMLADGLEQYTDARPDRFANWVANEKATKKANQKNKNSNKNKKDKSLEGAKK